MAPRQLCGNCDNRHGCASPEPPCLAGPRSAGEARMHGRAWMSRHGLLPKCRECALFPQCWTEGSYRTARSLSRELG